MNVFTLVLIVTSMVLGVIMFMASLYTYTWTISRRTQTTENMVLSMTMLATKYMEFDLQKCQHIEASLPVTDIAMRV
jgi:hypothetical protein